MWAADGRNLSKKVYAEGQVAKAKSYALGGFVYEGAGDADGGLELSLKYRSTAQGRVVYEGSGWQHEYHLSDHLGNTRVAFVADGYFAGSPGCKER